MAAAVEATTGAWTTASGPCVVCHTTTSYRWRERNTICNKCYCERRRRVVDGRICVTCHATTASRWFGGRSGFQQCDVCVTKLSTCGVGVAEPAPVFSDAPVALLQSVQTVASAAMPPPLPVPDPPPLSCQTCGTTRTSLWHSRRTECHACYGTRWYRERKLGPYNPPRSGSDGVCKDCAATVSRKWHRVSSDHMLCSRCFSKNRQPEAAAAPTKRDLTGLKCLDCGTTTTRRWCGFKANEIRCHTCHNRKIKGMPPRTIPPPSAQPRDRVCHKCGATQTTHWVGRASSGTLSCGPCHDRVKYLKKRDTAQNA